MNLNSIRVVVSGIKYNKDNLIVNKTSLKEFNNVNQAIDYQMFAKQKHTNDKYHEIVIDAYDTKGGLFFTSAFK